MKATFVQRGHWFAQRIQETEAQLKELHNGLAALDQAEKYMGHLDEKPIIPFSVVAAASKENDAMRSTSPLVQAVVKYFAVPRAPANRVWRWDIKTRLEGDNLFPENLPAGLGFCN